jgi:hypothetical protein
VRQEVVDVRVGQAVPGEEERLLDERSSKKVEELGA